MLVSNVKRVLKIAGFFLCFAAIVFFIDVNTEETSGYNLDGSLNCYYDKTDDYKIIAIGSSSMYTLYNPAIVDEITGVKSLNFGSAVQGVDDTYFLLKEMYRYGTPEYVFLLTGIGRMAVDDYEYGSKRILGSMEDSIHRLYFFIHEFQVKDILEYFRIPVDKFHISQLFNGSYLSYFKENYKNNDDNPRIYGNGYVETTSEFFNEPTVAWQFVVSPRAEKYLRKSIELCQKNGSKVVLINTPVSVSQFYACDKIGEYDKYFNEIAAEYGIDNWELSFLKKEHIEYTNDNFGDHIHTNGRGGQAYSQVIGVMIKDYLDGEFNHRDYFYRTQAECIEGHNLSE